MTLKENSSHSKAFRQSSLFNVQWKIHFLRCQKGVSKSLEEGYLIHTDTHTHNPYKCIQLALQGHTVTDYQNDTWDTFRLFSIATGWLNSQQTCLTVTVLYITCYVRELQQLFKYKQDCSTHLVLCVWPLATQRERQELNIDQWCCLFPWIYSIFFLSS